MTPTFTQVYTSVLAVRCAACHVIAGGIGITQGNLDFSTQATAYANLVNVAAGGSACGGGGITRVVPGMPAASLLHLKVSLDAPAPCGDKMPQGGPPLPQAEIDLIDAWILGGALND